MLICVSCGDTNQQRERERERERESSPLFRHDGRHDVLGGMWLAVAIIMDASLEETEERNLFFLL